MAQHEEGFLKISFEDSFDDIERVRVLPFANSELYHSNIKQAVKLTGGEDVKDIYDITLNTKNIYYDFLPGDTIGVLPNNNAEEVDRIFECLNCADIIDKTCKIILLDDKKKRFVTHIPVRTSLRNLFLKYVDIRSPPKKAFLKTLAKYTENEEEKAILEQLILPANSENYISFISKDGRSLKKLLQTFPSCKVPVERILENLPPLQPRPYSISSSPFLKEELHITFSVEHFDKETRGTCTGWLEDIITPILKESKLSESPQENVNFYFRKPNLFRVHPEISAPIIMIGPGTGVAPFVGFLQHLRLSQKLLDSWLFYGCRYKNKDYLYKTDLEKYLKENYLTKLSVAFSREQDSKIYVQDLIREESPQIYDKLTRENASIYICGDIKDMMKDVKEAIKFCLINNGMSIENANTFLTDMIKSNKYIEDKWF